MNAEQAIAMMSRCETEIMMLRATVDRLAPKADAYDNIAQLLGMTRGHGFGMSASEDVLCVIKTERQRLEREIADSKAGQRAQPNGHDGRPARRVRRRQQGDVT